MYENKTKEQLRQIIQENKLKIDSQRKQIERKDKKIKEKDMYIDKVKLSNERLSNAYNIQMEIRKEDEWSLEKYDLQRKFLLFVVVVFLIGSIIKIYL